MWLNIYLSFFVIVYLLVIFVLPTWRVYRATGINPVTFSNKDTAHDYIGRVMKVLMTLLVVDVVVFSFAPNLYVYLVPVAYLQSNILQLAGLIIIHIALLWLLVAQHQMQQSWRIGIDENNKTALVTKGLFSFSRNPVFLGMLLTVLGLFFIMPNMLLFAVLLNTYIVIQVQIRLEEAFLMQSHGALYQQYRQKVRRLV